MLKAIVFPKEILAKLHIQKGDVIYLCETQDGYTLSPYDEVFIKQMTTAEKIMHEERNVLKVLANTDHENTT